MTTKSAQDYTRGVLAHDRRILAKTITLIESSLPAHQAMAREVIDLLIPHTGKAVRLGITGVPGAGKSTFIESFGTMLVGKGLTVAVLTIDPSSIRSRGSILADKTRMEKLSVAENAYVRPSPSGGTLGGVARKTKEAMLVCEAAGFDVVIVETVGAGQSEVAVASMVDFFLVLMIPGAGDELQGIKKGIMELADAIVINKTDGENIAKANLAKRQYEMALHFLNPSSPNWTPPVLTCSALEMTGIEEVWESVVEYTKRLGATGELDAKRKNQNIDWLRFLVQEGLREWFYKKPSIQKMIPPIEKKVEQGVIPPTTAADRLLARLDDQ